MVNLRLPAISAITVALAILLAILLPHLLGFYYLQIVDLTLVSAVLALGLNFILGFGGQISLAQAAFFGIGAYGFAITALVGLLLGWPTLRLRGHYLALATLAFAVIVETLLVNADVLTGGADGLSGIPGIGLAGNNAAMLRVLLAVTVVGFLASVAFAKSPLGLRARAFRDDAVAAQALGINISMLKVSLFVVSATYAGVAGVAYDCLRGYISPDVFTWQTTFNYLAMVVVGGLGSSVGAILGALLYTLVPEWLRFLEQGYFVIFGLLVILVITFFPAGLVGLLLRATRLAGAGRRTPPRPIAVKAEGHLP
jgi:branched-chain amino acid transport system permease protein